MSALSPFCYLCLPSCLPSCWSLCPPCRHCVRLVSLLFPFVSLLVSLLVGHCVRVVSLLFPFVSLLVSLLVDVSKCGLGNASLLSHLFGVYGGVIAYWRSSRQCNRKNFVVAACDSSRLLGVHCVVFFDGIFLTEGAIQWSACHGCPGARGHRQPCTTPILR